MNMRILSLAVLLSIIARGWGFSSREVSAAQLDNAAKVLQEVMAAPDKGIPDETLRKAKCIAVIPRAGKGGFLVGAEGGRGVATCRAASGWSAPAFFTIAGGSWGLQVGIEGIDLVMIFQNEHGMEHLLGGKFQIGSDASAAAGPVGRHASADTDWKMNAEILTYARAKGVFAGVTLNGADIRADEDSTKSFYGAGASARSVLEGKIPAPAEAHSFLAAVRNAQAERGPQVPSRPSEPSTPRSTGRAFLLDSAREEAGYGLYSYLLFAEQPDENSKPRYIAITKEFLRLEEVKNQREWTSIKNLNITYIPLRDWARNAARTATADQIIAPGNYNYSRAQSLLHNLPGDQLRKVRPYGIYLISVLRPLSSSPLNNDEHILFEDLTTVPPEVAAVWVEHFKTQAAQTNFWEEGALESFALGLRTVIAQAAVAVDPSKRALSDWQDILASLIFWKGKK
ncbi:MAG TPA: lipid-binding SYLF domain-containing protein [Terracidiphilus sp.]